MSLVPGLNAVVVGRSLAEAHDDGELEAVFRHEEGRIRYRHALFITIALAALQVKFRNGDFSHGCTRLRGCGQSLISDL